MSKNKFEVFRKEVDKGFEDYCYKAYPELSKAYGLVIQKVEDIPGQIEQQLEELSVHLPRVKDILSWTEMFLDIAIYKKMPDKGDMTELKRKAKADYLVAEERAIRNKVKGLVDSIETRIMVLQSKLKSARREQDYQRG